MPTDEQIERLAEEYFYEDSPKADYQDFLEFRDMYRYLARQKLLHQENLYRPVDKWET